MSSKVIEIDPFSLSGQRELIAWCIYPDDAEKRTAYLAALRYTDSQGAEAEGKDNSDWAWADVKPLGAQRMTVPEILAEAEKLFTQRVTAASNMLGRLLGGQEHKVREGAAEAVASEMRGYYKRKETSGTRTSQSYVLSAMWTPYKAVAHLALAITQIEVESLPKEVKSLPDEQISELLWKAEEGHPEGQVLIRTPIAKDWARALDLAETIRQAAIRHPKVTIKDNDTIQFVRKRGSSNAF